MLRGRHTRVLVCTATSVHPSLLHNHMQLTDRSTKPSRKSAQAFAASRIARKKQRMVCSVCVCVWREGGGGHGGGGWGRRVNCSEGRKKKNLYKGLFRGFRLSLSCGRFIDFF